MKPGTINEKKANNQWEELVSVYKSFGIDVELVEPKKNAPDMVFAADQGLVQGKKVLLSHFRHKERRTETAYYEKWFKSNNFDLTYLPDDVYFEGNGEVTFWKGKIIIGSGIRSDKKVIPCLEKRFDREVISLDIPDWRFYHLDVGFFPLDKDTLFYYPDAYTEKARKIIKHLAPNVIEFTKDEAFGFAANNIITEKNIIMHKGIPTFKKKLKDLGYRPVEVEMGEFVKSGGGIHCLTNILEESEYFD